MAREIFRFDIAGEAETWHAIDDRVMGGVSRSRLRSDAGFAVFVGEVSLDHGGGFASVRSSYRDLGDPAAHGYALEVAGDGRRYKLSLRTDAAFDGVQYQAAFVAPVGEFVVVRLPLTAFRATWRGRDVPDAPPLDPANVRQAGFTIADRQAGPFRLAIRTLRSE